jgi:hypothetical protein
VVSSALLIVLLNFSVMTEVALRFDMGLLR